jgi:hypothetical protein
MRKIIFFFFISAMLQRNTPHPQASLADTHTELDNYYLGSFLLLGFTFILKEG